MADRRLLGALVAASVLLAGCGDDAAPTKAEFTARMRQSVGDLDDAFEAQGISPKQGAAIVDALVECQYDAVKDDPALLKKVYDNPGDPDVIGRLDAVAGTCTTDMSTALTQAQDPSKTTTTTMSTVPAPTVPSVPLPSTPTSGG